MKTPTRDDVANAMNAFVYEYGKPKSAAMQILNKVSGKTKLSDVPPRSFRPIIDRLEKEQGFRKLADDILVGLFGHTFQDTGQIQLQFRILRANASECVVLTYSWLDGSPNVVKILKRADVLNECKLYETEEDWTDAASDNASRFNSRSISSRKLFG